MQAVVEITVRAHTEPLLPWIVSRFEIRIQRHSLGDVLRHHPLYHFPRGIGEGLAPSDEEEWNDEGFYPYDFER